MPQTNITITAEVKSAADKSSLEKTIQQLAALPFEDRDRIAQIINNKKALKALADKWTMLKMMF